MSEQLAFDVAEFAETRSAVISDDGQYRYRLDRRWGYGPRAAWVMLNPSTADAEQDDATIRRIRAFSQAWGFSALTVVNLYAWRATDPAELWTAADPVGPDNDRHIVEACVTSHVIAAWGAHARLDRIREVLALPGMDRLKALALTQSGQPRHPLYLRGNLKPEPWVNPDA
jgi:hypothetical protein